MNFHEDFGDSPAPEETQGYRDWEMEQEYRRERTEGNTSRCASCKLRFPKSQLAKTGMYEYYTMDVDPSTLLCADCYETTRERFIPDDPALWDGFTPVQVS